MPLTPETLTRHEPVGLPVRVAAARDANRVGIAGRVVAETMRTLVVRTASGDRRIPKQGTTFEFAVAADGDIEFTASATAVFEDASAWSGDAQQPTDEAAGSRKESGTTSKLPSDTAGTGKTRRAGQSGGCEGVAYVTVDGARLLSRPAYRTERNADRGDNRWQSD